MGINSVVKRFCKQTAVYWANPTKTGYGGDITYDDPVEIKCRWDYRERMTLDRMGKQIMADVELMVTQDLDIEGMLYLGTLNDLDDYVEDNDITLDSTQDYPTPDQVVGVYEVIGMQKITMPRSLTQIVRTIYLREKYA